MKLFGSVIEKCRAPWITKVSALKVSSWDLQLGLQKNRFPKHLHMINRHRRRFTLILTRRLVSNELSLVNNNHIRCNKSQDQDFRQLGRVSKQVLLATLTSDRDLPSIGPVSVQKKTLSPHPYVYGLVPLLQYNGSTIEQRYLTACTTSSQTENRSTQSKDTHPRSDQLHCHTVRP